MKVGEGSRKEPEDRGERARLGTPDERRNRENTQRREASTREKNDRKKR